MCVRVFVRCSPQVHCQGPDDCLRLRTQRGADARVQTWQTGQQSHHECVLGHAGWHALGPLSPAVADLTLRAALVLQPGHGFAALRSPLSWQLIRHQSHHRSSHARTLTYVVVAAACAHVGPQEQTEAHTTDAIKLGYRGLDTANQPRHYDESAVGAALSKAYADEALGLSRGNLFLQTKFTPVKV
jgi:hypothetical protein